MKKKRILGRQVARELEKTELQQAQGGASAPVDMENAAKTYTLTYPPDSDPKPGNGGGGGGGGGFL